MTIYVDPTFTAIPRNEKARGYGNRWCHMVTDGNLDELHTFAELIGLKRAWFQDHPTLPHYDLTPNKRALAVQSGAKQVGAKELALINYHAHKREVTNGTKDVMGW